jgi:uncharacterized membrane protein YgcG
VPLSEHEQRVFDEIEQSLADDPKFASAVRAHDPRHRGRRRMIAGGLISLVGLIVMVLGVMSDKLWLGAVGAVITFAGMVFALHVRHKTANGDLSAVGGKSRRRTGSSRRHRGGGSSWGDRMEDRWRRRRDTGWM